MKRSPLAVLIVTGPFLALLIGLLVTRDSIETSPVSIPASGPITIALTGDMLLSRPLGADRDVGFREVADLVRGANLALANLEMNLLDSEAALRAESRPSPRWPFGSEREARTVRWLGFDALALANDHATDYGSEGLASTMRILDAVNLLHAGAGENLQVARAPKFAEQIDRPRGGAPTANAMPRRVALIAVAASSFDEARATLPRGDIAGRPGVSPLRYAADITVDPATFQTLKESLAVLNAGPPAGSHELTMFGTPIKRGERTVVEFIVDEADEREILDVVKAARAAAETVIVSLHSHEPANASDQPAAFARGFARGAIEAGATIVVGHGPHRLRGIELYKDGVILYSLGNFLYQAAGLDFRAANLYDQGADLYQAAVGSLGERPRPGQTPPESEEWWEGLLAIATVDQGRVDVVRLYPLDLGTDKSLAARGIPRVAKGTRAERILKRLEAASEQVGGGIVIEQGTMVVRGSSPRESPR